MRSDTLSGAYTAKLGHPIQPVSRPLPLARARSIPLPLADADALLVALRRSLESCKDTTQLRMLAAFEGPRLVRP